MLDVLQVPFEYYPDPAGGTEVYVAALCRELRGIGLNCGVAAPAPEDASYAVDAVPVRRYRIPGGAMEEAARQQALKRSFAAVLDALRPRLVHFHALSPGIGPGCVEAVVERDLPLMLTYHTPTLSCPRGTMMAFGRHPCDGRDRPWRCTACVGQRLTGQRAAGVALAAVPATLSRRAATWSGRVGTALGLKAAVARQQAQFHAVCTRASRVVAVCEWVRALLLARGLPAERVVLSRQGLAQPGTPSPQALPAQGTLRLCFLGRLDPTKGVELLLEALGRVPGLALSLDLYGVPSSPAYRDRLAARVAADPRVRLLAPIPSAEVVRTMQAYDAVLVPSQWLETGPLVVLEAQAAGRPVIGSRLGGIAELVRDGVDGWLLPATDPAAWAGLFAALSADRSLLLQRSRMIQPPRTMREAALDMAALYRQIWSEADRAGPGPR
ncbi:MAG: glycosyltransferase [Xanthomonadales bacterium]|jgi:glycosyltransferase involved in cell wall biosynthesis|nr:glycosyltransferase [Xanthomonadales bacterium]